MNGVIVEKRYFVRRYTRPYVYYDNVDCTLIEPRPPDNIELR